MSTYVPIKSVCGAVSTTIDQYDYDLNPHGVICCDNCQSIVLCRKDWDFLYKENKEMKTNFELTQEINTLAKKHYGDMDLAFAWGCAQALLSAEHLQIILNILKEKEVE